jgi:PAS domain S-box-containing protein
MAVLILLLGILVSINIERLDRERRLSDVRSQVIQELATIRARLEGVINTVFSATSGLTEVIAHQGGISPDLFDALARQAIKGYPALRNIAVAPDNTVTLVYPLEGNRQALGLRYETVPKQYATVQQAMQAQRPIFSGPHDLVQGGKALIARVPVFTSAEVPPGAEPRYWGMVSVVTRFDTLLDAGGVQSSEILEIGLRIMNDQGHAEVLLRGEESLFARQPVYLPVSVPGGTWQLAAVPKGGWPRAAATDSPLFYIGVVNSLFAAALVWWLVTQPARERGRNEALQREMAERRRIEEECRLSEQKYASFFHLMPDMVGVTRMADGCFLEINPGFSRVSGWEKEEVVGRTSLELGLWTPEARAEAVAIVREQGRLENFPFILGTKSGAKRDALMFLVPIKAKDEDCLYFMARDVTELTQAQRVLEQERARLRQLLQTIPALIWMKDPDGVYLFCNARFERFFNASEDQIIGRTDYDFFDRELADFFRSYDRKAIAAGQPSRNEEWVTYADDGHRELLETIKTPVYDGAGQLMGVLGVAWDITEKKRIEGELRQQRTRFINLVDSVDGVVWEADAETFTFTYVSKQAERLLGYPIREWYGEQFWRQHLHPEDRERMYDHSAACTARGEEHTLEYRFLAQDGRILWVQDLVTVVAENGQPRWRRGIMVDITGKKEE